MDIKEDSAFVCDVCGKAIANKCNLKRHKLMHSGLIETVKCGICQKTLSSEGNLKRHMRIHVGVQERQECGACGKSFSNVGNLRRHLRTHQAPGMQFECKLCKKCFPYEDYLKKHVRTVHGCNDVKRKTESSLPHIESFITREDSHKDETSDQSTNQPISGTGEEELVQNGGGSSSDGLTNCDKATTLLSDIKVELQDSQSSTQESNEVSNNSLPENEVPELNGPGPELREKLCPTDECSICRQVLTDPAQVKLNVWRMHLDMRMLKKDVSDRFSFDYNCTVCGKFLSNKGNLKRHMLLLHKKDLTGSDVDTNFEQMRAECHICGRMVANKGNLKRHMEKVHIVKRILSDVDNPDTSHSGTLPTEINQFYPLIQPAFIKVATATSSVVKIEPPAKKRRYTKQISINGAIDDNGGQKVILKAEPKRMDGISAVNEPNDQINNDSTNVETDTEGMNKKEAAAAENSTQSKGSNRWRSRSFDDVYDLQTNLTLKNGLCQSQWSDMYSCPMCNRRFLCDENVRKHMKRHRMGKSQKLLDNINEVASNSLLCHICGQLMPFPAALQHHLQVVHATGTGSTPSIPTTRPFFPKPQNELINWSYPPILTRFLKRDGEATEISPSAFTPKPTGNDPESGATTSSPETASVPTTTFSAPTTPLRKYIHESRPASNCVTPDGGSPVSASNALECDSPSQQKDGPPVLVIMQPRCM